MRQFLRILALLLAVGVVVIWLGTGARRGWTTTEDTVKTLDDVTGIEGISQKKKFRAGVDFLGAGLAVATVLACSSFAFRPKSKTISNPNLA